MKIGVVTGFTGSIGKEIVKQILEQGHFCLVPTRNRLKAEATLREIAKILKKETSQLKVQIYENVHLDSLSSLRNFASKVKSEHSALDFLINNAAIVVKEPTKTKDDIEVMLQVNVVSYWLLAKLFKPLLETADGRIVNVASNYAGDLDLNDLMFSTRSYNANSVYRQSKACNRLLSTAAARKWKKLKINACHPGVVDSNLLRGLIAGAFGQDSAAEAAKTPVYLALSDEVNKSGLYWQNCKSKPDTFSSMVDEQEKLWDLMEHLTNQVQQTV